MLLAPFVSTLAAFSLVVRKRHGQRAVVCHGLVGAVVLLSSVRGKEDAGGDQVFHLPRLEKRREGGGLLRENPLRRRQIVL
jgi:hypothetical protein